MLRYQREHDAEDRQHHHQLRLGRREPHDRGQRAAAATFVYDGDGKRVKVVEGSLTTYYIGDYYEWRTGPTTTAVKYYYAAGQRIAMREGSTLTWLLGDHLGSTTITATENGTLASEQKYTAWGQTRSGSVGIDRQYTGQISEPQLGIYFYNARFYDPYLTRFLSPDTIVPTTGEGNNPNTIGYVVNANYSALVVDYHENQFLEQSNRENRIRLADPSAVLPGVPTNPLGFDRYAYTLNNPVRYNDPSGHCILCLVGTTITLSLLVIATVAAIDATTPGNPEAFAQSVDNLGDQLASSISSFDETARMNYALLTATTETVILKISLADKLPTAGDFPYNPPKRKGNPPYVRAPQGGFRDANGNVWRRDKSGHRGSHWDVEHPDGSHTNVDDEGKILHGK